MGKCPTIIDTEGSPLDMSLQPIKNSLESYRQFHCIAKYECRPKQITVEPLSTAFWEKTKSILLDIIIKNNVQGVKLLESSHSIDVIAPDVSKLHLVTACEKFAKQIGNPGFVLCIGDKGEWPGNDYELLSTPYSISVDTVSHDHRSCWNLSQSGHRGVQATLAYLNCTEVSEGILHFKRRKIRRKK